MVRRSLIACMFVVLPLACDPNAGPGCTEGLPVLSETRLAVDAGGHAWDIEATGDGGFIIAGYAASGGGAPADAYLVKTDISGAVLWERRFGGEDDGEAVSVAVTGAGEYILAGVTGGVLGDGRTVFGETDLLIAKADTAGNEVWTLAVADDRYTAAFDVCVNPDGSFAVIGVTAREQFGDQYALLMKLDAAGVELWRRRFPLGAFGRADGIVATQDGGYAFTGYSGIDSGVFVTKTDGMGAIEWAFRNGGEVEHGDAAIGRRIVQTRDGGYAVVCDAFDHLVVLKLNAGGALEWAATAPGAPLGKGYDLVETESGDIIAAGESFAREPLIGARTCIRPYVVRLGIDGALQWNGRLGSPSSGGSAYALTLDVDGNAVLVGPGFYLITVGTGLDGKAVAP